MATSSAFRRTWPAGVAAALLLAAGALSLVSAVPSSSGSRAAGAFSWVHGGGGRPPGWPSTTTASRSATLFYPPGWKPITGDRGTVSVAQRDSRGNANLAAERLEILAVDFGEMAGDGIILGKAAIHAVGIIVEKTAVTFPRACRRQQAARVVVAVVDAGLIRVGGMLE